MSGPLVRDDGLGVPRYLLDLHAEAATEGAKVSPTGHRVARGWYCTRCPRHTGPCAARPYWWNLRGLLRLSRRSA